MMPQIVADRGYSATFDSKRNRVILFGGLKGTDHLTYEESVSKYFLGQYVRARESWLPPAALFVVMLCFALVYACALTLVDSRG